MGPHAAAFVSPPFGVCSARGAGFPLVGSAVHCRRASVVLHAGPARAQPGGVTVEATMIADRLQQVGCIVARQQRGELAASGVNEVFLHDSGLSQNHGWASDRTSSRGAGRWCASP
jgi:hypothetical protein